MQAMDAFSKLIPEMLSFRYTVHKNEHRNLIDYWSSLGYTLTNLLMMWMHAALLKFVNVVSGFCIYIAKDIL